MPDFWDKVQVWFEHYASFLIGAIVACAYLFIFKGSPSAATLTNLFIASISVSAITIGFLATTKSILFTVDHKRIIKRMKEAGQYNKLVDFIFYAITWSSFLLVYCIVGLLLDFKDMPDERRLSLSIWMFLFVAAASAHHRIVSIFTKILKYPDQPEG